MRPGSDQHTSFLLDRTRAACRQEGYSSSTEARYLYCVRRLLNDFEVTTPGKIPTESPRAFCVTCRDTYSTKKQARNALRFFFDEVLMGPTEDEVTWDSIFQTRAVA